MGAWVMGRLVVSPSARQNSFLCHPSSLLRLVIRFTPVCLHLGRSGSAVLLLVLVLRDAVQSAGQRGSDECLISTVPGRCVEFCHSREGPVWSL